MVVELATFHKLREISDDLSYLQIRDIMNLYWMQWRNEDIFSIIASRFTLEDLYFGLYKILRSSETHNVTNMIWEGKPEVMIHSGLL